GPRDLPPFVAFGDYHDEGDPAAGKTKQNFLGPAYGPMLLRPGADKDEVTALLTPPPHLDLSELESRDELRTALDMQVRRLRAAEPAIAALDQFQQSAFDLLCSPKLRAAIDPKQFDAKDRARYGDTEHGMHFLAARRLIEAGVPFVFVPWRGWDW